MSASVKQAREALGARLREIRKDAGLTGRALADSCGWHFTKVSKIEHGSQNPSEADIRRWCETCSAHDQMLDLIATVRAIESMYIEWHRHMRTGLKHSQASSVPLYERTKLFRGYENTVLPGLFHTADYAAVILDFWFRFLNLPDDVDAALAARMERQRILYTGDRKFVFVLEEQTLRTNVGGPEVMLGQLDRMLAIMTLPRVSVGIIPSSGQRRTLTQGSFWIFDSSSVQVEGVSAGLEITQPREIDLHERTFELLQESAVYGQGARNRISNALSDYAQMADKSDRGLPEGGG
ncbi:MAG TPA: helix-turn-helix transcriptional regulator [Bryobacteraceae bacterium]|nr:helix-turn-helix transcriptional regulator [Bryobacteraceae bacterium]